MAVELQISPSAKATNEARDDLKHALCMWSLTIPLGTMTADKVDDLINSLDRYIEAKLQPRRY